MIDLIGLEADVSDLVQNLNRTSSPDAQRATRNAVVVNNLASAQRRVLYRAERHLGKRTSDGSLKLKKLTPRHYRILALHIQGLSAEVIQITLGCSLGTVYRVIKDPLSQPILGAAFEHRQQEIESLAGAAVNAIRDGLAPDNLIETRLKAVDKFSKLRDSIGTSGQKEVTAEDIISTILQRANVENLQININSA